MNLKAGQSITCDKGHTIATALTEAVEIGKNKTWTAKLAWEIPEPMDGSVTPCPVCGSLWFLQFREVDEEVTAFQRRWFWICIDGKWVPPLPPAARAYLDETQSTVKP